MNKKFSTLLVGAMLATVGVGSVSAAGVKLDKADGTYNTKLYQIAIGQSQDSVIVMTSRADGSDSLYVKARTTLGADSLANSLWCVAVTKPAQAGQSYIYDFRNKATGKKLAIDINPNWKHNQLMGDTLAVGVDLDGWAFSETAPQLSEKRPMYVYIPGKDSVAALGWDQTGARGGLEAMKVYAHADTIAKQVTSAGYVFTLMEPDHLTLNATALHTLLGRNSDGTSVQFHFWKGDTELKNTSAKEMVKGFVLGEELIAKDTTTARGTAGIIFRNKKTGNYLRVDSGWHNKDGVRFNVLTDTTTKVTFDLDNAAKHIGQYIFQVNYAPAGDSLYMRVDTAIYNNTFVEKDNFHRWTGEADSTYIVLQNLTANQQWALTVGKDSVATRIGLGIGTCGDEVGLGRTSVKDGLYTIKDKATGKYYAYPLYGNGSVKDWVEFDEESQLAAHMPAYQWIIDRTYDTGDLAETSPITVENREYKGKFTVQLYKDAEGKIFARNGELVDAELVIEEISKDAHPEAYDNKYLGYFHRPEADITYNVKNYVFKYFHPYALDEDARYLTINNDSLLYAKQTRNGVNFELQSYDSKDYNYGVGHDVDRALHGVVPVAIGVIPQEEFHTFRTGIFEQLLHALVADIGIPEGIDEAVFVAHGGGEVDKSHLVIIVGTIVLPQNPAPCTFAGHIFGRSLVERVNDVERDSGLDYRGKVGTDSNRAPRRDAGQGDARTNGAVVIILGLLWEGDGIYALAVAIAQARTAIRAVDTCLRHECPAVVADVEQGREGVPYPVFRRRRQGLVGIILFLVARFRPFPTNQGR